MEIPKPSRLFILEDQPEWFMSVLGQASSVGSEHHDVLEGVLGVSRLLMEHSEDSFRVATQLLQTIVMYQNDPTLPSEQRSTQIQAMIQSGLYPKAVCDRVTEFLFIESS